jgi:hypothetical protein
MDASEAARALGSIKTAKKAASSRENGRKCGGQLKPLETIPCTCGGAGFDHKTTCPRGIRIRVRQKKGLPLG